MSFHEENQAKLSNWKFIEVWVDPTLDLPYMLMLVCDVDGIYKIYDPTEGYKVVYSGSDYTDARYFLLEDEYVQIRGRYQDEEVMSPTKKSQTPRTLPKPSRLVPPKKIKVPMENQIYPIFSTSPEPEEIPKYQTHIIKGKSGRKKFRVFSHLL